VGGDRRVNHQDPGFFGLEHADYFQVWTKRSQVLY
jgi:hypothetical protein